MGRLLNFNIYEVFDSWNEIRWARPRFSSSFAEPQGSLEIPQEREQSKGHLREVTWHSTPDPNAHLKHITKNTSDFTYWGTENFPFLNGSAAKTKIHKLLI